LCGELEAEVEDAVLAVPPVEKGLEVVVEHEGCECGDREHEPVVVEDQGRETDDGDPLVGCHFFPHVPVVAQVEVDEV